MYSHAAEELLLHGNMEELKMICAIFQYLMLNPYKPQEDTLCLFLSFFTTQEGEQDTLPIVRITQLLGDEINCNSQRQSFHLHPTMLSFSCLDKNFLGRGLHQIDTVVF